MPNLLQYQFNTSRSSFSSILLHEKFIMFPPRVLLIVLTYLKGYLLPGHTIDIPQRENLPHLAIFYRRNKPVQPI